jgi:hypothetical protein
MNFTNRITYLNDIIIKPIDICIIKPIDICIIKPIDSYIISPIHNSINDLFSKKEYIPLSELIENDQTSLSTQYEVQSNEFIDKFKTSEYYLNHNLCTIYEESEESKEECKVNNEYNEYYEHFKVRLCTSGELLKLSYFYFVNGIFPKIFLDKCDTN